MQHLFEKLLSVYQFLVASVPAKPDGLWVPFQCLRRRPKHHPQRVPGCPAPVSFGTDGLR